MSRGDREEVFEHSGKPPSDGPTTMNQWVVARNVVVWCLVAVVVAVERAHGFEGVLAIALAIALAIREVAAAIREHKT